MAGETTHTPQGDGNRQVPAALHRQGGNNPHPARGRKPVADRAPRSGSPETTHTPQGDGNLGLHDDMLSLYETTHTPQGDGNKYHFPRTLWHPRNNPHPARGRKRRLAVIWVMPLQKQPTPRKGTETILLSSYYGEGGRNNPHPARGRKPRAIRISSISEETTHTPQGDGNP